MADKPTKMSLSLSSSEAVTVAKFEMLVKFFTLFSGCGSGLLSLERTVKSVCLDIYLSNGLEFIALLFDTELFTEVEVNSGGYLPSFEAAR